MSGKQRFTAQENNPALAFISGSSALQSETPTVTPAGNQAPAKRPAAKKAAGEGSAKKAAPKPVQDDVQEVVQEVVHTSPPRRYIRTQGRKGHKKPRINMAFDNLDDIREYADATGKSITQFVNDVVADYIEARRGER